MHDSFASRGSWMAAWRICCAAFVLVLVAAQAQATTPVTPAQLATDRATLLQGLTDFEAAGTPSAFGLYETRAFAVVAAGDPGSLGVPVAASSIGDGRVIAFGNYYLDSYEAIPPNVARFLQNAIAWSNTGRAPNIGVLSNQNQSGAVSFLTQSGLSANQLSAPITSGMLQSINTLVLDATSLGTAAESDLVREFVRKGGALLIAANGWAWPVYTAPGKSLKNDFLGNQLLAEAGIVWTERSVNGDSVISNLPATLNAMAAYDYLIGGAANASDRTQATESLSLALNYAPFTDNALFANLNLLKGSIANVVPSAAQPFSSAQNAAQTLAFNYLATEPVALVTAHASAAKFPGAVAAGAARVSRQMSLNKTASSSADMWQSTGLYAAAGEKITVSLTEEAAKSGLVAVIGAHTDDLNNSTNKVWTRAPIISRSFPLSRASTTIASAFGGLIYVKGVASAVNVTFDGVVLAPRFKAGVTTLADWRETQRTLPAPWAEFESNSIIVTVQSDIIRGLDDPQPMLAALDLGIAQQEKLAAWDAGQSLPMRFVFDQQISAGYMHSGYPVMAQLSSQKAVTDFNAQYAPFDDTWGYFHEFGHNHQSSDWVFNGTTEVSVNLFSMIALEGIYGRPKEELNNNVMPNEQKRRMGRYFAQAPDYGRLSADPWDTLIPFMQLVDGFGWDAMTAVFKEYRGLAQAARPKSDDEKIDQWLTRYSKNVGRNLGPFFDKWGFKTSAAARDSVASLPAWLPEPDFPAAYTNFVDPNVEINGAIKLQSETGPSVYATVFRDGQACGVANVVNGYIRCTVPKGWSGNLSFQRGGYRFAPNQVALSQVSSDQYIGTVIATVSSEPTVTIRGKVSNAAGTGLAGVFPMAPGADCRASDANGNYSCTVDSGWSGRVSMNKAAYTFTPANQTLTSVSAAMQGVNFVGASAIGPIVTVSKADCVFNWAELNLPQYFSPAGAASVTLSPYYYRYYTGTTNYLATSSVDNHIWVLGPSFGTSPLDVGPLTSFLGTTGCSQ